MQQDRSDEGGDLHPALLEHVGQFRDGRLVGFEIGEESEHQCGDAFSRCVLSRSENQFIDCISFSRMLRDAVPSGGDPEKSLLAVVVVVIAVGIGGVPMRVA